MIEIYPRSGDWGTVIQFRMLQYDGDPLDLSSATSVKMNMRDPGGTVSNLTASLVTDGTDGKAEVTITSGQWDGDGVYTLEPEAIFSTGRWAGSPWIEIEVKPSLV